MKQRRTTVPEALDDGWPIATPESVGLSVAALEGIHRELLREDRYVGTLALLVVKDGKLVWETYLRSPADRDRPHHVMSVTKTVTSLVVGTALARGELPSLDVTVAELFPAEAAELPPEKQAISLRQLLTMRSGLAIDNEFFSVEMWVDKPRDPLRHLLRKPLYALPGEEFYYRDADPQIVSYALTRRTGRSEADLARERIFAPLGITDWSWGRGPDGITMGAHGLWLRPRDLAKLGQLLLGRGSPGGVELVPAAWVDQATSAQVTSDVFGADGTAFPYGYYLWIVPGVGFTAWGHGGQFVLVVPARRLVLVQIAYPDAEFHGWHLNDFLALVAPLLE